ncbi:ISL3 family transposase [Spirillospora sp. NPDC048819]|uniref:ISL3 family transposase n=1 Tax=Spirillospora sp. NPDC048819 TaxID=3155268 RepID=UPI0033FCD286
MSIKELLTVFFPHLDRVRVDQVFRSGASVRLKARTATAEAACPSCGTPSRHRHSRYERRLSDTAVGDQELLIHLQVHRFLCRNDGCGKRTFAEQVPGLTVRYGRRSVAAGEALRAIALALAGRPGARLAERLVTAVSRMTLLRLIRRLPDPTHDPAHQAGPRVLGVDDFALRRGRNYGTILIDITTGKPVDVLADRTADTLANWLHAHPGVEIVCRDRAGAYADGISRGAPEAIQVADRWHLWRNIGDAVERTVTRHRRALHALTPVSPGQADGAPAACTPPPVPVSPPAQLLGARRDRVAVRTRERHAAVHTLIDQGRSHLQIACELELSRNTVRRFARTDDPDDLLVHAGTGQRPKELAAYDSYLRHRWNQGCTNAAQLFQELRSQGYRGAATTLRQYLQPWRTAPPTPPAGPARRRPPTVRQATGWFLRHPAHLDPDDQRRLDALCAACPQLNALRTHVRLFAEIMMDRTGQQLQAWMTSVLADDLPELHSFVTGLRRDQDAVTAGLTLPYSSGPVEGHVNRIKTIKRQMYGRASFDLLRKRILLND